MKPEIKTEYVLDFLDCLYYLENDLNHTGIKEFMWEQYEDNLKNDSYFQLDLDPTEYEYDDKELQEKTDRLNKYLKLIKDTWDIKTNSILMGVCW